MSRIPAFSLHDPRRVLHNFVSHLFRMRLRSIIMIGYLPAKCAVVPTLTRSEAVRFKLDRVDFFLVPRTPCRAQKDCAWHPKLIDCRQVPRAACAVPSATASVCAESADPGFCERGSFPCLAIIPGNAPVAGWRNYFTIAAPGNLPIPTRSNSVPGRATPPCSAVDAGGCAANPFS